jgi:hypothetical protein
MMTNRKLYSVRLAAAVGLLVVPLTLGACDDDNDVATPPVATAEASPELDDITDDYFGDASYIGKRVTVQGTVTKVIPPASFVLAGREYGDDALLVVSAPKMDVQVAQQVDVTGVVRQFDYETYADDYDLGTDAGLYIEFEQEEVLIAGGPAGSATSSPAS